MLGVVLLETTSPFLACCPCQLGPCCRVSPCLEEGKENMSLKEVKRGKDPLSRRLGAGGLASE